MRDNHHHTNASDLTLTPHPEVARHHIRLLDAATREDQQVLLTELLVAVYPTSMVQDS